MPLRPLFPSFAQPSSPGFGSSNFKSEHFFSERRVEQNPQQFQFTSNYNSPSNNDFDKFFTKNKKFESLIKSPDWDRDFQFDNHNSLLSQQPVVPQTYYILYYPPPPPAPLSSRFTHFPDSQFSQEFDNNFGSGRLQRPSWVN